MSKIEKLVKQHCPDGVEYKHLWEVTTWDKRFNAVENYKQPQVIKYKYFLASELKPLIVEGGTIKILTTNNSNLYTTEDLAEENYSEGEIIAIPWGGNPIVQYFNGKFLTSDNRIAVSNDTSYLNTKYLYYCLLDSIDIISTFYRGSGIKHPNMAKVLDFQIPIPPLAIQQEIVTILDKFTALEAELEAELEARSRQYEYYRNQLLAFEGAAVEWKTLGEVAFYPKKRISYDNVNLENYVGVENLLQNKQGKTFSSYVPSSGNLIQYLSNDILIGNIRPYLKKIWVSDINGGTNGDVLVIRIQEEFSQKIKSRYLFYLLSSDDFFKYSMQFAKGAKMPRGDKDAILKFKIPIPSLEEQERIVNILDQFDALVNDIKTGLPAEIKARRAQYEYYRKKLLTFKMVND